MSPYRQPNDAVSLTLDWGSLVLPLELAGPLVPDRRSAVTTTPFAAGRPLEFTSVCECPSSGTREIPVPAAGRPLWARCSDGRATL